MKKFGLTICFLYLFFALKSQSVELFPGNAYFFSDIQFLKNFDSKYRFTIFSRTRAQVTYDEDQVSFFSAAYLNYTTKPGLGISVIGRMNNFGSNVDGGLHFLKKNKQFTFFGILSLSLTDEGAYSWFSIIRYRPAINERWKVYTSFELFTAFKKEDHLASIQRLRVGLDYKSYQFGLAANLAELGNDFIFTDDNYGVFLRKEF